MKKKSKTTRFQVEWRRTVKLKELRWNGKENGKTTRVKVEWR